MTDYSPGWVGLKFYPAQEFHETLKIVVKVSIHCEKCKQAVFKAVTKLTGIDQVSLDEEKGLLTIIGTVDPVVVVERVREKTRKRAYLESVGPVDATEAIKTPAPGPEKEKHPEPICPPAKYNYCYNNCECPPPKYTYCYNSCERPPPKYTYCYNNCELVGFAYGPQPDGGGGRSDCTIL
ncbi:hypothetical protein QQ045_013659 [Rhodiola kirilowii]